MPDRSTALPFAFLLIFAVSFFGCRDVLHTIKADEEKNRKQVEQNSTIRIGQPIKDVKKILSSRKIKSCENCMEVISSENDHHLEFTLDEERTNVAIFYSRSSQTVGSVFLVVHPSHGQSKTNKIFCPAKAIRLFDDRTYSVHFMAPHIEKERKKAPSFEDE